MVKESGKQRCKSKQTLTLPSRQCLASSQTEEELCCQLLIISEQGECQELNVFLALSGSSVYR